jgi:hypothetical protein
MSEMICYCFGFSAEDIERDYQQNGPSDLPANDFRFECAGNFFPSGRNPGRTRVRDASHTPRVGVDL